MIWIPLGQEAPHDDKFQYSVPLTKTVPGNIGISFKYVELLKKGGAINIMISVNQLLKDKQGKILTVTPEETLFQALKVMADKNVGALVVVKEEKVVGIFSERDFVRNAVTDKKLSMDLKVKELMSTKVCYVRPEQTIEECMVLMTEKRTRHLPVLDGDKLIGIVSIGDVLKNIISEKEFKIQNLENYISGGL